MVFSHLSSAFRPVAKLGLISFLLLSASAELQAQPFGPPNDRCDHVLPRSLPMGGSLVFTGNNAGATNVNDSETGTEIANSDLGTVWHAFTLTSCSRVTVAYCGTAPAFTNHWNLLVRGCPAQQTLPPVALNDLDCGDGNRTMIYDQLEAGTYYIPVLEDVFADAQGPYTIHVSALVCSGGAPPNDLCGAVLPKLIGIGAEATFIGDNTGATFVGDGETGTLIGSLPIPTVWHAFELEHCASVLVDYCGTNTQQTNYWNLIASGCPAAVTYNPTQILGDECGNGMRSLFFASLDPGIYYLPVIYDPFAGAAGPYEIRVRVGVCAGGVPPNDRCSDVSAVPLRLGVPQVFVGDNRGSTSVEDGSPGSLIGDAGLATVWHAFTLEQCARITVDYCGTVPEFGNYWNVLATSCPSDTYLNPFEISDTTCANGRRTLYYGNVPPGTYYLPVLLDAFNGASGRYEVSVLALNCTGETPANDRCADISAEVLTAAQPLTFNGNNTGATALDDGLPGSLVGNSGLSTVWHAFTIEDCQTVSIAYCRTDPLFGNYWNLLFRDCPADAPVFVSDLNDALCEDGARTLIYNDLDPGTYYIPVLMDVFNQARGPYELTVTASACDLTTTVEELNTLDLRVYPVPARDVLLIDGVSEGAYQLEVIDAIGRPVLQQGGVHGGGVLRSPIPSAQAGVYLLRIKDTTGSRIVRFVTER